ncbi:MAG: hypothetical protein ABIJ85_02965 [bacterium]
MAIIKGGGQAMSMCTYCGKEFNPNPRVKRQRYCVNKACQRARRSAWQRAKIAGDPDYQANQERCRKQWQACHPAYYRLYRDTNPTYTRRNRILQKIRDNRRRKGGQNKVLAKMDSLLKPYYSRGGSTFRMIVQGKGVLAKMDSLIVKLIPVSSGTG